MSKQDIDYRQRWVRTAEPLAYRRGQEIMPAGTRAWVEDFDDKPDTYILVVEAEDSPTSSIEELWHVTPEQMELID